MDDVEESVLSGKVLRDSGWNRIIILAIQSMKYPNHAHLMKDNRQVGFLDFLGLPNHFSVQRIQDTAPSEYDEIVVHRWHGL